MGIQVLSEQKKKAEIQSGKNQMEGKKTERDIYIL